MTLRLFVAPGQAPLASGATLALPEAATRHAQVRRVQPGDALVLFDGSGVEARATVQVVGRREVGVRIEAVRSVDRELPLAVTLAVGMPANERMDALVEKATELGMAALQPLVSERSVLQLEGERAARRRAHWQAVAVAAAEQCGRTRVPAIAPVQEVGAWLAALSAAPSGQDATSPGPGPETEQGGDAAPAGAGGRWLLSAPDVDVATAPHGRERDRDVHVAGRRDSLVDATAALAALGSCRRLVVLSGPEGGLTHAEQAAACARGFLPVGLGPRVLRADTAPLALLAWLGLGRHGHTAP